MKKFLFTFSALLLVSFCFSQTPGVKWTKYYIGGTGGNNQTEVFFDGKCTTDSVFILAGSDTAYQYNKEEFLKKYVQGRPWLVKTDKDGNVLWRTTSQDVDPYNSSFTSIQQVSSGGIIAVGYGRVAFPQPQKFYIAKYNNNGGQLWYKIYGGTTGVSRAYSVQETSDGGYVVAGNTT